MDHVLLSTLIKTAGVIFLLAATGIQAQENYPGVDPGVCVSEPENSFAISGGSPGGLYTHTSGKIAGFLNSEYNRSEEEQFVVVCTGGSKTNVENLLSRRTQLAIVQSDILYAEEEKGKIFGIASLFPEYTQILVNKNSDIDHVVQLVDKKVFTGKSGSGTQVNAQNVLSSAGLSEDDYVALPDPEKFSEILSNEQAMEAVCSGKIDAAVRVTGSVFPKLGKWKECLKLIDLDPDLQGAILEKYPFYGITRIDIDGKIYDTLFTRAVLVASQGLELPREQIQGLARFVERNLPVEFQKGLKDSNAAVFQGKKIVSGLPIEFNEAAFEYFNEEGLLKNNKRNWAITIFLLWLTIWVIKTNAGSRTTSEQWVYARSPGFVSHLYEFTLGQAHWLYCIFQRYFSSFWQSIKDLSILKSPVTVTVAGLAIFLSVAALSILTFESFYATENDIPNQFENMPLTDFSIWLLQVLSLGESPDGLFPKSVEARAVTVIIPIAGVVGAILAVLMATIREKSANERRARGFDIPPLQKHIVVCGWNGHGARVVDEITTDMPGKQPHQVAVLSESHLDKPLEEMGIARQNAHYFRGMSSDSADLDRVSAGNANGFLVLAGESKTRHQNFRSIFTVQMISKALEAIEESRRPRIMVDMVFKKNLELFRVAGADRVLNSRLVGSVFLAYSSLNMGFSNVITNLMSLATRPVLARANVHDHKKIFRKVEGLNFRQAWNTLLKSGINLLAIIPRNGKTSPTMGIYPDLPNPVIIGEDDYVITGKDSLVIIENQALRHENVNAVSFADSHTDVHNGLDHTTPLVVIDRRNEAGSELRALLKKRCSDLYYICAEDTLEKTDGDRFIPWDGHIDSITDIVRTQILDDLERQGKTGKVKFLIPSMDNPLNYSSSEAVHKDDDTVALILQLKTMDEGRFHYTAEIQCMQNLHLFKGVGVQQPIPVHEFASLALSKMTLFDGEVTGLILRLMENYFTGALEHKSLRKITLGDSGIEDRLPGMTYFEAAMALFPRGIQLLAIISHDENEQNNRLIALPHKKDADFSYRVHPDDELFVIS